MSAPSARPPVGYYGAKVRLARRIVDLLPPHRAYPARIGTGAEGGAGQ